jgi:arsenite methyltransferase
MSENNKTVCCSENIEGVSDKPIDNPGCCEVNDTNELEEVIGCDCGGVFPDQSQVLNPDNPIFEADDDFFRDFEKLAKSKGIVSIGYTSVVDEVITTEKPLYSQAIVLTYEIGQDLIKAAPSEETQKLNELSYDKLAKITYQLSDFIREKGFTSQVAHPHGGIVDLTLLAQKAGLGYKARNSLLITPELGPRLKISAIFTSIENLPQIKHDDHSWIIDYCEKCGKCIRACPEKAMIENKLSDGKKETEFRRELCTGCDQGCTYCIKECIFDLRSYTTVKNIFDKLNSKLAERKRIIKAKRR